MGKRKKRKENVQGKTMTERKQEKKRRKRWGVVIIRGWPNERCALAIMFLRCGRWCLIWPEVMGFSTVLLLMREIMKKRKGRKKI